MKKILMVTHTLLPDHRIDKEAQSLSEKGYKVSIICTGIKREPSKCYEKIYSIPLSNREKSLLPYASKQAAKKISKIIDEVKPDLIHAHDIMAGNIVRIALPKEVKFVYDTHEDWELLRKRQRKIESNFLKKLAVIFYTYPITRYITKKIAKKADLIVLTTKYSIPYFIKIGINPDKIITIENFPLKSIIEKALKSKNLIDEFIRKEKRKKLIHSSSQVKLSSKVVRDVTVFAETINELDDWVMIVFGPEDEEFLKLNVKFLPPRDQIAYLASISECDVAINPLIVDERTNYSSPNRVFEFVSLGLKVISSKTVYLEDKFKDYLIWAGPETPKDEIKQILSNVESFHSNDELKKIGLKFIWEEEIKKLYIKYTELLEKK